MVEDMLAVSDITQYFYCPRKVYFMKTLGIKIKAKPKMDMGKEEHEKEHRRVKERNTVYGFPEEEIAQVIHDLAVEDINIGLYGMVDTTIIRKSGEVVPVDVKYTDFETVRINWRKQLTAYALLLDSRFKTTVKRGFVYFPAKRKQIQIDIPDEAKDILKQDIKKINGLIDSENMPNVSKGKQCSYCEMKKFCT
jgi:CRISPR-associated exonuclease Cas4